MKKFILLLVVLYACMLGLKAETKVIPVIQVTSVWDMEHLAKVKKQIRKPFYAASYEALLQEADDWLKQEPLSVMMKKQVPASGDKHDYMSIARYYWPDPSKPNGLPYINKDGEVNPEIFDYDRYPLGQMVDRVIALTLAWYFSGEERYAAEATKQVRVWFLDKATCMNPNLEYSQVVMGKDNNKGRSSGLIDTYSFIEMLEAVTLLEKSRSFTEADSKALKAWFEQLTEWMLTSPQGKKEAASANNHSVSYDTQIIAFALYSGNRKLAEETIKAFPEKRLFRQVEPDGSQPQELRRTLAFHYSRENLTHVINIMLMAKRAGLPIDRLESADGRSFYKAIDFLTPYVGKGQEAWPYQQISGWEGEVQSFCKDLYRIASCLNPAKKEDYLRLFRSHHVYHLKDRFNLLFLDEDLLAGCSPKVILKLDDLSVKNHICSCASVMDVLKRRGISASFGVIMQRCDTTLQSSLRPYMQAKDAEGNRLFEFWHHGYDHKRPEFGGASYEHQKRHFELADSLGKAMLGIELTTFGAPFNQVDSLTARVIQENGNYRYVFFANERLFQGSDVCVLNNRINMEDGTGKVDYKYFLKNYKAGGAVEKPYIVLQGHPNQWDEQRIKEFVQIIEFLQKEGCEFVLPSQMDVMTKL